MKSSVSYQPLSRTELDQQIYSAKQRIKPQPYLMADLAIVQLSDMVIELEGKVRLLEQEEKDQSEVWPTSSIT